MKSVKKDSAEQILAGFHSVTARLRHAPDSFLQVYVDAARRDTRMLNLIAKLEAAGIACTRVPAGRLDGMAHGTRHQGVLALGKQTRAQNHDLDDILDALQSRRTPPLLLLLDGVTDPHNLGACLRTADAAGVHAVIAPRDRAVGLNATVQRVACGAAETVPYLMVTNLARTMRQLKERGVWLVGTDERAASTLYDVQAQQSLAWVMGAEGDGLRRLTRETCDELVRLPMLGAVESLNVSAASAVCLFETVRQRQNLNQLQPTHSKP